MRISDWSSDVCSSDLLARDLGYGRADGIRHRRMLNMQHPADAGQFFRDQKGAAAGGDQGDVIRLRLHTIDPLLQHGGHRSEEHTSELQSLMRISYAVFCLKKKK